MSAENILDSEYNDWFKELISKIRSSQIKGAIAINKQLLQLHWEIGRFISNKISQAKWGTSVVEKLSKDLKRDFPDQKGFSRSNLFSMKQWFEFCSSGKKETEIVQQLVGHIPWGHNVAIVARSGSMEEALFYCKNTLENNGSRAKLKKDLLIESAILKLT